MCGVARTGAIGTTSACAENTGCQSPPAHHSRNYLRVRGEYPPTNGFNLREAELPPRARRILPLPVRAVPFLGTTSACAENTPRHAMLLRIPWNYLRVRGEYALRRDMPLEQWELPPRARRILREPVLKKTVMGTTSACAENTGVGEVDTT